MHQRLHVVYIITGTYGSWICRWWCHRGVLPRRIPRTTRNWKNGPGVTLNTHEHDHPCKTIDPDTPDGPYVKPLGLTPYAGFVAVVVGSSGKVQNDTGFNYPAHRQFEDGKRALVECGSLMVDIGLDGRSVLERERHGA